MKNLMNSTSLTQKFVTPNDQLKAYIDERVKSRRDYTEKVIKQLEAKNQVHTEATGK